MRIAFVIPSLGAGGAERVATLLCNEWAQRNNQVTTITFDSPDVADFFSLSSGVTRHHMNVLSSRNVFMRVAINIRRLLRLRALLIQIKPDIVVAFTTEANVVTLCATRGLDIPVVISERNQPNRPGLGYLQRIARRLFYPLAAAVVVQTHDIAWWVRKRFRVPVHVVPNPVQLMTGNKGVESDSCEAFTLVAVGRLARQKGLDILIKSFAPLAEVHPRWQLVIYGKGPERMALEALVRELSLTERVSLPGLRHGIDAVLSKADLFVLPSRFEGYPNALLEALSLGCPVVATTCPGATIEILENGRYGRLVPSENVTALRDALNNMMADTALRRQFAQVAPQAVRHLDIRNIGERWLELLTSAAAYEYPRRIATASAILGGLYMDRWFNQRQDSAARGDHA